MNIDPVCQNCRRQAEEVNQIYVPIPVTLYRKLKTYLTFVGSPGQIDELVAAIIEGYTSTLQM